MASDLALPLHRYPRSWWQVAWSHDLAPGDVRPLKYFGEDLVVWRGLDGEVFVQDAFCPHLGAHRGVRGTVVGNDLQCPWHGWQWDGNGRNTLIPYSREGCARTAQVRVYPAEEWYGMIMVWWAPDGRPPEWDLPEVPELDSSEYYPMYPYSHQVHRIKAHTQAVLENTTDPAHVQYVHGSGRPAELTSFVTNGTRISARLEVPYGVGSESTKLTPTGEVIEKVGIEIYGMGFAILRFESIWPTIQISSIPPVDDEYCDYYFQQTSLRVPGEKGDEPTGVAKMLLELQQRVITMDFFTWENMKYLDNPIFAAEEAKNYAALRRWCRQFYPSSALPREAERDGAPAQARGRR